MFHLKYTILSETLFGKNVEAAQTNHFFQLVIDLQSSVTYFRVAHAAHQNYTKIINHG
jgi:hypothetical protein